MTERAAAQVKSFLAKRPELPPLRLRVVRTHCMGGRGHAYDLRVAEDRAEEDVQTESRGVKFLLDPESARLVRGIELDFVEAELSSGFALNNPNAVGKCPCGHHDLFA
jgi:iron-sulfur cluster assembly protein